MVKINERFVIFAQAVDKKGFELDVKFCFVPETMESPIEIWQVANSWLIQMTNAGHKVNIGVHNSDQLPF